MDIGFSRREGIDCEIPHRLDRRTKHSFKIVRLKAISDGLKRTIPTSGGLELLQMLSESFIGAVRQRGH